MIVYQLPPSQSSSVSQENDECLRKALEYLVKISFNLNTKIVKATDSVFKSKYFTCLSGRNTLLLGPDIRPKPSFYILFTRNLHKFICFLTYLLTKDKYKSIIYQSSKYNKFYKMIVYRLTLGKILRSVSNEKTRLILGLSLISRL